MAGWGWSKDPVHSASASLGKPLPALLDQCRQTCNRIRLTVPTVAVEPASAPTVSQLDAL